MMELIKLSANKDGEGMENYGVWYFYSDACSCMLESFGKRRLPSEEVVTHSPIILGDVTTSLAL